MKITFFLAVFAFSIMNCTQTISLPEKDALLYAKSAANANNRFSVELLGHYLVDEKQKNQNIFFSPFSISSAVSMTGEGAKGQTRKEIFNVFHLDETDSLRQFGFLGLMQILNNPKSNYKLNTSNSLWIGKNQTLDPGFLQSAVDYYHSSVEHVDFKNALQAAKTINDFVESKTEKRIQNLVDPSMIKPLTRLVLTNTIYFKADWKHPFKNEKTYKAPFTTPGGNIVSTDMMGQQDHFNYLENEAMQAVEMEYKKGEMSMIVILPKNNQSIADLNSKLPNILKSKFTNENVRLTFPKFKFETSYLMTKDLSALGMPIAFTNAADFSGINGKKDLQISEVVHKAFIEVAEKGTEAAAATAVMIETTSVRETVQHKTFTADHPFIFVIRHNATGAILFMGVVNNPS